jgi:hypothetical protein
MANIVKNANKGKIVSKGKEAPTAHVEETDEGTPPVSDVTTPPAGVTNNVGEAPPELPVDVADNTEAGRLLASQATLHSFDPRIAMQYPGNEDTGADVPSTKDHLLNDHKIRLGNKRRFLTDALSRALGCEAYLLEVDKPWAPNPLGKGGNIAIRYTREMVGVYVLFDKFDVMPDEKIVALKKRFANEHGYKYVYETPAVVLTHEVLTRMLEEQRHVTHPESVPPPCRRG